jgi:hypothetical protein
MFAAACQTDEEVVVSAKIGTNNCFINIKSREFERRTAGMVLDKFDSAEAAQAELRRRAQMRNRGVGDEVGDAEYEYEQVDRNVRDFVRGSSMVSVGSDIRLCSAENLLIFARALDARLK